MIELTKYISEKLSIDKDTTLIEDEELYKINYEKIKNFLTEKDIHVKGNFRKFMGDYDSQRLRLSYLEEKDEPDINMNGTYITFDIDFRKNIVDLVDCGHIWLTKEDQHKSNLVMTGLKNLYKVEGKPYFRKSKFKNIDDCIKKIFNFYNTTKDILEKYTEGYPFHQMKINIY